ncbi:flagellar hook-basal body complex protein, partial [Thiolapillus sp.]
MSFNTALSGIRAASGDLGIIGNNIANANTVGFKGSRGVFGDVYAASLMGAPGTAIGQGVRLKGAAQLFGQGNIAFTGNAMDLAINGRGFFQLSDAGGGTVYSRAGNFHLDRDGYVANSEGLYLMARSADANGAITGGVGPLRIDTSYADPNPTTALNANINFDARAGETDSSWALVGGVPDPAGYNSTTTTSVYDSQGNP